MFIKHLLCERHCAQNCIYRVSLSFYGSPTREVLSVFPLTRKQVSKVKQLARVHTARKEQRQGPNLGICDSLTLAEQDGKKGQPINHPITLTPKCPIKRDSS